MSTFRLNCDMLDVKMWGPSSDKKAPITTSSCAVKRCPAAESYDDPAADGSVPPPSSCLLINCTTAITLLFCFHVQKKSAGKDT